MIAPRKRAADNKIRTLSLILLCEEKVMKMMMKNMKGGSSGKEVSNLVPEKL